MIEKELKIRDICGDYALDIPFADGSVNTIYFNSKRTESGNTTAGMSAIQIIYVLSVKIFSLFTRRLICIHIALTVG